MDRRLEGKVALVTGASSGIGRATAVRLGREGAAVGVNYRSDEDGAREVVREIEGAGGKAVGIQGDVSREEDARRMVRASVEAFGDLDVLVNNAGVQTESPFLEMSLEDWQKVISVDLTGTFLVSREAISHMVETGGGCSSTCPASTSASRGRTSPTTRPLRAG